MSTKNLGRTAVERGRTQRYRDEASRITRVQRARERVDAEDMPGRERLRRSSYQTDNLNAVWRYLEGFDGKPWNKVYSELRRRFDARTLLGRHVLFDHVIGAVMMPEDPKRVIKGTSWWDSYYVDDAGIFRVKKPEKSDLPSPERLTKIEAWLKGRGVVEMEGKLYWAVPDRPMMLVATLYRNIYYTDKVVPNSKNYSCKEWPLACVSIRWDLNRGLSRGEVAFYRSLPAKVKDAVTIGETYYVRGRDVEDIHRQKREDRARFIRLGIKPGDPRLIRLGLGF